jgi:hypothetical protein
MGFIGSMFDFWRGAINFKFMLAKTQFHSGRLRLTWFPGAASEPPTEDEIKSAINFPTSFTKIIDIFDNNEFEFSVPFTTYDPVLPCLLYSTVESSSQASNQPWHLGVNGYLILSIETPLTRTNTATSQIDILTYLSGGSDIQFYYANFCKAIPEFCNGTAVPNDGGIPAPVLEPSVTNPEDSGNLVDLHSEGLFNNEDLSTTAAEPGDAEPITSSNIGSPSTDIGEKVFGETTRNLRPVTRKFAPTFTLTWSHSTDNNTSVTNRYLDQAQFNSTPGDDTEYQNAGSPDPILAQKALRHFTKLPPFMYISFLYRFYTGGRRYKFFTKQFDNDPHNPAIITTSMPLQHNDQPISNPNYGLTFFDHSDFANNNNFSHKTFVPKNPVHEVEVPNLRSKPFSLITSDKVLTRNYRRSLVVKHSAVSAGTSASCEVFQALADDANFSYLVGAPAIVRVNALLSTSFFD